MTHMRIISTTLRVRKYKEAVICFKFIINPFIIITIHYYSQLVLFVSFLKQNVTFTDSCYYSVKRFKFPNRLYHLRNTAGRRIDRSPGRSCVRRCQCSSNPLYPRSRRRRLASSSRNFATRRDAERRVAPSLDDASRSRESRRRTAAPVRVCVSCETIPFPSPGEVRRRDPSSEER